MRGRFTATEKYECAKRELSMRQFVYSNRVAKGKMKEETAKREIALMEEIAADYLALVEKERLL